MLRAISSEMSARGASLAMPNEAWNDLDHNRLASRQDGGLNTGLVMARNTRYTKVVLLYLLRQMHRYKECSYKYCCNRNEQLCLGSFLSQNASIQLSLIGLGP